MVRPPFTFVRNTLGSNGSFCSRFIASSPYREPRLSTRADRYEASRIVLTRSSGSTSCMVGFCAPSDDGLIFDSKNTILLERPRLRAASTDCELNEGVLSVMYITELVGADFLHVCFGKVISDALSDQLITFTRCLREALPIKYRDFPSAALNQTCAFQLPSSNGDGWPLGAQHFGEEILRNQQRVIVTAVTHHE